MRIGSSLVFMGLTEPSSFVLDKLTEREQGIRASLKRAPTKKSSRR